jgi:putative transposase
VTLLAYRFALDPTPAQERALRSHAGAARVAFNWGLARVKANLSQREAEKSYGITGDDLTPSMSWSLFWLRKDWNAAKARVARGGPSAARRRSTPVWTNLPEP